MKSCARFLLFVISSLFITLGLLLLILRINILNSETYKKEIENFGIYELIETQLKNPKAGEGIAVYLNFVNKNIELTPLIQQTIEKNLDNVFTWLSVWDKELVLYFPKQEISEKFTNDELKDMLKEGFLGNLRNQPNCTPAENQKFLALNLESVQSVDELDLENLDLPQCKPTNFAELERLASDFFDKQFNESAGGETILNEVLKTNGVANLDEETPASELDPKFAENVGTVKRYVNISLVVTIVLLVLGLILAILNASLSKTGKGKLKVFVLTFLPAGIILLVIGVSTGFFTGFILERIPFDQIQFPYDIGVDSSELSLKAKLTITNLITAIFDKTLLLGVVIVTTVVVVMLLSMLNLKRSSEIQNKPTR